MEISSKTPTAEVKNITYEKCEITKDVEFHTVGDSITYSIKIKNNDDKSYTIKSITDDNTNEFVEYEYESYEGTKIEENGDFTISITETYATEAPISSRNQSLRVNFSFVLEDEEGNTVEEVITTNPQTGDNVGVWATTAIASLLLLIILSRKKKLVESSAKRNTASRSKVARTQVRTKSDKRKTKVAKSQTRSPRSSASKSTRNSRSTKSSGKYQGKHCGKGYKLLSVILAIAIIFPVASRAVENTSLVVTLDTNISFRDKLIVQYESEGKLKEKVVKYNELLGEIEEPTKSGYEFEKWVLEDGTPFNPETPIKDDIKITAKFKTLTYTIAYDLKEGSLEDGKTNPVEYTVESEDIELNKPTKEAYTFAGWTGTALNGTVENVTIAKGSTGNREYTANWTTSDYTITYNLNGGTATGNPSTYTIESNDINLNKPTKFGYTFTGWTGTDLADKTEDVTIVKGSKGNREYTATWTPTVYTITYQGLTQEEETALNNPTEYTIETQAITLNNPQDRRDGDNDITERFVGWRENVSVTTNYNIPGELGDKIIEAVWVAADPNVYTVTYNLNGGTLSTENRTSFTKFDTFTLNNPTKRGYTFSGWTGSNGTTPETTVTVPTGIREDLNYTANWTPSNYTIITKHDDGTEISRIQYTIVSEPVILETPTKTGYTFTGWTGTDLTEKTMDVTIPTGSIGNREYTENWQANTYAIVFDRNTGSGSMRNQTMTYDEEANLNTNEFTKTGYTFAGWNTKADGQGIHYDNGQQVINLASEQGAEFTLYAEWTPNNYQIAFNKNDNAATGSMANQPMTYDTAANLTPNAFEKTNYTFIRWNTQADGQGVIYRDGDEVTNLATEEGATVNLYAVWEGNQYRVIFDKNNENATGTMEPQEFNYDVEQNLTANGFSYLGYKFMGWTLNPNGTGTVYTDKQAVMNLSTGADVTLYAKWREIDAALNNGYNGNGSKASIGGTINTLIAENPTIKNFVHYEGGIPSDEIKNNATDVSATIDPIYVWADGENIYWWSEDLKPRISGSTHFTYMFHGVGPIDYVDLTGFDTSNIISARSPFEGTKIKSVNISDWDLSNATDIGYFAFSSALKEIRFPETFHLEKVTNAGMAFNGAPIKNLDVSGWIIRDLRDASSMFAGAGKETITFGDGFKTDNVTSMAGMFSNCSSLTSLDVSKFNTSNVTNMSSMFAGISNITLDLSRFDTRQVKNMSSMFNNAKLSAIDISLFSSESLTNMQSMFANTSNLASLTFNDNFTAENVTNMSYMFQNSKLSNIDLSQFNAINVTTMGNAFFYSGAESIDFGNNFDARNLTDINHLAQGADKLEVLDLSTFKSSQIADIYYSFWMAKVKTIYVSEEFGLTENARTSMGFNAQKLVGGAGSNYTTEGIAARIDDPDNGNPGYFSIKGARYIRYNGNGADNAEPYGTMTSHYLTNTGSLKANAYTRDGYTFVGWNTEADGSGTSYTDKQLMSDIVESKTPLTLYAQWEKNRTKLYDVANVGDYVEYKPTTASYTPNSNSNVTGTIYPNTTTSWRVLSKNSDGTIDLISTNTVGTLTFGKSGYGVENNTYANLDNTFEGISNSFINSNYAGSVRIPSQSDFNTIKNNGLASSQNYILNKKDYESRSTTGDHEGGATWDYYIYYANGSTMEKFRIWYKYAGTGGQSSTGYSTTLGIRPIVRLKANLYTNDGTGTSGNSYKITN